MALRVYLVGRRWWIFLEIFLAWWPLAQDTAYGQYLPVQGARNTAYCGEGKTLRRGRWLANMGGGVVRVGSKILYFHQTVQYCTVLTSGSTVLYSADSRQYSTVLYCSVLYCTDIRQYSTMLC